MVVIKVSGERIVNVIIVNIVRNKFEVWIKGNEVPLYLEVNEVLCMS